ncbi:MAG: response regulator [Desulfobacterales bacterium]|nr:response regulator [Desulfobacterales bacterium]MDJ0915027.1 response regulator [Desulfobacterales bacterium]
MADTTVLIIEDNELNRVLVKVLFEKNNYLVLEAENAEDGLDLAHQHQPDVIIMDIQLPGMDGITATKALKKDPTMQAIPVVALTSYAMQGDEERALAAGCSGYITKPINTRTFIQTVTQYIQN